MLKTIYVVLILCLIFSCSSSKKDNPSPSTTITIDGGKYETVAIGSQSWTTVNYNGTGGMSYDKTNNTSSKYGKYYTLAEANAVVLPLGWRIPSKDDCNKLLKELGALPFNLPDQYLGYGEVTVKVKSKEGWTTLNGNNTTGFNAYPSGAYNTKFKRFGGVGDVAVFWTSTLIPNFGGDTNFALAFESYPPMGTNFKGEGAYLADDEITNRLPLRFVKDN